jgi:ABC-2 type transport system permease protein
MKELRKWFITITIALTRYMSYKADFLLTLLAPSFVFILINYNVWDAVYSLQSSENIAGFSRQKMLSYQCWAFIASLLIRSHRSWNLSEDIRYGRITAFLVYPFSFWKFHACEFISFQIIQLVIAGVAITALLMTGFLKPGSWEAILTGVAFSLTVSSLWFAFEFSFGLAAFWLEETWIFRYIFQLFAVFLSGFFIPLELFPAGVQNVLQYTPFPFLTSVPVHIFMGTYDRSIIHAVAILLGWIGVVALTARLTWKRGLSFYTGAGI